MDDLIRAINYALDCSSHRLQWYIDTNNQRYMDESKEWADVASIYMNQLILEQKHETCES